MIDVVISVNVIQGPDKSCLTFVRGQSIVDMYFEAKGPDKCSS